MLAVKEIKIGDKLIGNDHPTYFIAEIGINHNGSIEIAKKLIDLAVFAGCDAVKFQKRTPEICVPKNQRDKMRETPWGYISYMEYRHKMEFGKEEYDQIDKYCKQKGFSWFASCWDKPSVDFILNYDVPCLKLPSPCLTDIELANYCRISNLPMIISTGMSTMNEIDRTVNEIGIENLAIMHCTSTYPCANEELNLSMLNTLKARYECPIGYSGHEQGLPTTIAAVALGARLIERHITLDRAMWGSDQAASIAPIALIRLMNHIRAVEKAMGDGIKKVQENEEALKAKLRLIKPTIPVLDVLDSNKKKMFSTMQKQRRE